jgi:hypothetical protein
MNSSLQFVLLLVGRSLAAATGQEDGGSQVLPPDQRQGGVQSAENVTEASSAQTVPFVFEGFVLDAAGVPAAGAVVVSSAGGKAVADESGFYHLDADVPLEAAYVQLTAVGAGGRSLFASTSAAVVALSGYTWVGSLSLTQSASCQSDWLPTFGAEPGVSGEIDALAVYDDGAGPALYAGGSFTMAGGATVNNIAKWDGTRWSALGLGVFGRVRSLTVFDNGAGPALYAGGSFVRAGGVTANNIAKWNGTNWSTLGSGMNSAVYALTVYDVGDGPALYTGGVFTSAGGVAASYVAKWNGTSWSALGSGVNLYVYSLTGYDAGSGPGLYAGGAFTTAGGATANRIARWDGTSWSSLGSGMNGHVRALKATGGGSPALYAGGDFTTAGGVAASYVAKWNGTSWSSLGSGMNNAVHALTVFNAGGGPALCAGGWFTTAGGLAANRIARWNGTSWSALGSGFDGSSSGVLALAVYDAGGGPALHGGGLFFAAGGVPVNMVAKWDGASWSALGSGLNSLVGALTVYDDGGGTQLYAGGAFTTAGGVVVSQIAKWDATGWSALGSGMSLFSSVYALTEYDDGGGPALYASGDFETFGGVVVNGIAKWDGTSWSALGSGMSDQGVPRPRVEGLAVFDDGGGPALYAGGFFTTAGGVAANRIAKWDGQGWSALGSGMTNTGTLTSVLALAVFDDGNGPALYAGGMFTTAGGLSADCIAKWDGTAWSALGSGLTSSGGEASVRALTVYDDGGGPALYVGGLFTTAGGVAANGIAKWDGASWSALGSGMNGSVWELEALGGDSRALFAGGDFTTAGGAPANSIARWDGTSWSALGGGLNTFVGALTVYDDGGGSALYAGGAFSLAAHGDSYLARWILADTTPPALTCPEDLTVECTSPNGAVVDFAASASDTCDPSPGVVSEPPSGSTFPPGTTTVLCTAIDASANFATCTFDVTVVDTTPPSLHCPPYLLVGDRVNTLPGEVVHFTVQASDTCSSPVVVVCTPPSGSFFPRGRTLVSAAATDAAGNVSTCSFPVTVAPGVH